jgi:selenocysteine lyase/cysteine desulfurase
MDARGGTVAFNLRRDGHVVPYEQVEAAARALGIALRGGCFCNPGAAAYALRFSPGRTRACLRGDFSVARFRECMGGRPVGALRASVGLATNERDIVQLGELIARVANRQI